MKIEKIGENTIRVTISLADLEERNINIHSLNYNSDAAQELFWDMVEQAEVQLGFNISDCQLIIEPIPDIKDGFTITITRVDEDTDFESIHKYIRNRFNKADLRAKRSNHKLCSPLTIYSFEDFEDLCALCEKNQSLYVEKSSLYKLADKYYLVMVKNSFDHIEFDSFEIILSEFGTKVENTNFYEGYLNEYGTIIIKDNAIQIINKHF
jgi:adapter protein MecA 1/2